MHEMQARAYETRTAQYLNSMGNLRKFLETLEKNVNPNIKQTIFSV